MKPAEEYHQVIEPLIEDGDYQAAIGALDQLLTANPDFAGGYYELGTIHYKYGDKDKVLECYLKAIEKEHISTALRHFQGNISRTAKALQIPRSTLRDRLKDLGVRYKP